MARGRPDLFLYLKRCFVADSATKRRFIPFIRTVATIRIHLCEYLVLAKWHNPDLTASQSV
jgi:hypothetical protein